MRRTMRVMCSLTIGCLAVACAPKDVPVVHGVDAVATEIDVTAADADQANDPALPDAEAQSTDADEAPEAAVLDAADTIADAIQDTFKPPAVEDVGPDTTVDVKLPPCPSPCDDGDPCTADVCHPWAGCIHTADAQQPGCPCPWWGHTFDAATKVMKADPLDDGRTLVQLETSGGVTYMVLDATGNAEPVPVPANAKSVWPRADGWGALIPGKNSKLFGYDKFGKVVWSTMGPAKQTYSGASGMQEACPLVQFVPQETTFGKGLVWVTGPSPFISMPSFICSDGGPHFHGWLAYDADGQLVSDDQLTIVGMIGESTFNISFPVAGMPLVFFEMDFSPGMLLPATGDVGPSPAFDTARRTWEGGVLYAQELGQWMSIPGWLTRIVPEHGIVWSADWKLGFHAVGEWPNGTIVGNHDGKWAALPADGTATTAVDLPAALTADAATPAWHGGFIVRGKLDTKAWVGHVALRPGKPLVCK